MILNIGFKDATIFEQKAQLYCKAQIINIDKNERQYYFDSIIQYIEAQKFDLIIASLHSTSRFITRKYVFVPQAIRFINQLPKKNTIYIHFGNLYALDSFPGFKNLIVEFEFCFVFQNFIS